MIRRPTFWLLPVFLGVLPSLVTAQCVGDCNGDGSVAINETITAVNIGLGQLAADACPAADANGDGSVAINEVIVGVTNGLAGCPALPTPSATRAPTATPTAGVDVSGTWGLDQPTIVSATCPSELEPIFVEEFLEGIEDCTYLLQQDGRFVQVTETCEGEVEQFSGVVDGAGRISIVIMGDETIDGCFFTFTNSFSADASTSPTVATNEYDFRFAPSCELPDCSIVVELRLRRI